MVSHFRFAFFLLLWFIISQWAEAAPIVDASIDSMNAHAHYPLTGIITITHQKGEIIDPNSFTLEGKKLEVSFGHEVLMSASSDTLVSIYNFELPPKDQGLYALPEISVKISNETYHSVPSSYDVKGEAPPSQTPIRPDASTSPLIFRLEAMVIGPSTLYPGERTKLFYRISYNRSIDLTKSELPMIHPSHFQKVGDVKIRDYQEQNVTVQELTQEVEAADIGTFQFGPSLIEGYAYTTKGIQKIYDKTLLQAKAPIVTVEVKPFPQQTQPASFTGAIGVIKGEASLESPGTVSVGDTVQVLVKIHGIGNLPELRLSLLQCQPGFSGFFQTSDLPPMSEVKGEEKLFHLEIRPMTSLIQNVPSIELSSFDPNTGQYVVQKTDPIPITVNVHPTEKEPPLRGPLLAPLPEPGKWPAPSLIPLEIEIEPISLTSTTGRLFDMKGIFWVILGSFGLLALQYYLHYRIKQRPIRQKLRSDELWRQAVKLENSKLSQALPLIEQAIWHRLWEKGILDREDFHLDKLPEGEKWKPIRTFLFQIQALQYSPSKEGDYIQLKAAAKQIFHSL